MSAQTLGRLWARYFVVRKGLGEGLYQGVKRREAERQAAQFRDRLVVNYSPLVRYVAGRTWARTTANIDQEDMISWGILGLLDAIETYDPAWPGKKARFESYAITKIRWAIFDEMRRQDWVPRRVRMRAQKVEQATINLTQDLRRPPTDAEVAQKVGMKIEEYRGFQEQYSRAQIASLEARMEADNGTMGEFGTLIVDPAAVDPQSRANLEELRAHLVQAIGELEDQERVVATFYFYDGLTLKEIGKAMSLTEGRISQLLRRSLTKLRERLQGSSLVAVGWQESLE